MNFEQKYNNKKQNSTKLLAINDDSQYDHTSILATTIKFQNNTNQINNNKYPIQPHYESNNLKTYKFDNSTKVLATQNQFSNPYNHKNTTHSPILNEKNLDLNTNKSHFNNENNQKDITQSYLQFISSSAESPSSSSSSSSNCQNMINKGQSNTLLDDSLTSLQWLQNLNIMKSATNCNNSTNNPNIIYTDTQLLSPSNDKESFLNLSCKKQSKLNDDFISPELDLDCSSAERMNLSCQILDLDTNSTNNIINNCNNNLINLNNNHINSVNFNSSSASSSSSSPNSFIYQQQIQNIQQQFPLSPAQSSCASSPTSLISIQQPLAITNNTTNNKGVKRSNSAANAANKRAKQTAKTMITSQVKFRLDNNLQSYSVATSTVYSTLLKEREEFRNNSTIKPPYSYSQLIILAMKESSYPKMTLQMIYDWIIENFSYFKKADPSWQITFKNSIRHNLSLNKCFKKIARQKDEPGKGGFWTLDPEFEKQLNETNSTNSNVNTSQSNEKNNDLSNLASSPKTSTTPKQLFNFNLNKRRRCQNFANTKSQLNKKSKNKTNEETAQQTADKSLAHQKNNESKDPLESTNTFLSQYDQFNNKNQLLISSIKMEKNNFTMLKDDYITDQVAIKNEPNSVNDFININIPNQTNQSSMNTNNSMFLFDSNSTVNDNQNNGAPFIMRSEPSWLSTESNLNKKVTNCNAKPLNIMNDGDCLISDLLNQNNQQFLLFSPNQSQQTPQHHQQYMVKPVNCYNSSISPVPSFQCNSQNKKSNPNDFYQINNLNNSQNQYISYDNNNINIKPDDSYKIADHLINTNALDSNNSHCFEDRNLRTLAGLNNSCLYNNNNSNNSLQRLPTNLYQHNNHHQMPNHCNSSSHQLINNGNFSTAQSSSLINTNNLMVEDMTGTFSNSFAHEIIKSMDVEGSLFSFEEGLECNFDIDQLDDTTNELSTNHNKNFLCNLNSNHNYFNINNAQHSLQTLQTKQQMPTNLQVNNNNLDEFLNESFKVTPSSLNSKVNTISSLSTSSISSMSSNSSMTSNLRTNQRQQTNNNDNELIELLEYTSKFNLENNQLNAQNSMIPQMHMDIDTKNKLDLTIEGTSIKQPKWWNEKNDECDSSRYFNDYQLDMPIDMNSSSSTSDIRKVTNTQINETNCYNELAIKPLLKKRISNNSNSYYNHRTI